YADQRTADCSQTQGTPVWQSVRATEAETRVRKTTKTKSAAEISTRIPSASAAFRRLRGRGTKMAARPIPTASHTPSKNRSTAIEGINLTNSTRSQRETR